MKKKINKECLGVLVLGVICITLITSDFLVITISTLMGYTAGWTWFGFITFIGSFILLDFCIDYLQERYKKTQKKRTK